MSVFVRVRLVSARDDLQGIVELHVDCGSEVSGVESQRGGNGLQRFVGEHHLHYGEARKELL